MRLSTKDYHNLAVKTAVKSQATKRKVGCVVVVTLADSHKTLEATGFNYNPTPGQPCEMDGVTLPEVIHAEVSAITAFKKLHTEAAVLDVQSLEVFVTHPPCNNCAKAIDDFAEDLQALETVVVVVGTGLKFDSNKPDFTMAPRSAIQAMTKVFNYGAKKYKRDNWREVEPERYVAALERHWDAYMCGELVDEESGITHLAHAMTNLAILIELNHVPKRQQTYDEHLKKTTDILA